RRAGHPRRRVRVRGAGRRTISRPRAQRLFLALSPGVKRARSSGWPTDALSQPAPEHSRRAYRTHTIAVAGGESGVLDEQIVRRAAASFAAFWRIKTSLRRPEDAGAT